jgi:hypothetical protein
MSGENMGKIQMRRPYTLFRSCALVLLAATVLSCTKSDGGDDSSGGGGSNTTTPSISGPGTTQCGVVVEGVLKNPVKQKDGETLVFLGASGANLVIAAKPETPNQPFLIKLHGVGPARNSRKQQEAIAAIKSLTKAGGYFIKPVPMCQTYMGGQLVAVGSVMASDGTNLNEYIILKGYALPDSQDVCNGLLLDACYQALSEENATAGGIGCRFLWKPVADKDGKAVIHAAPCNTRIVVNGEEFKDAGSGNGRCSTGRGTKTGCAYGQATIQVFDKITGLPYEFPGGQTKLVVNGCDRVEPPCYE